MHDFYKTLKEGDEFFEYGYGETIHLIVTEGTQTIQTQHGDTQYVWKARMVDNNDNIDYLITEGYEHYGPKIYQ